MPPRGSKLQRQKSASDQQSNNDDQSHLLESNQKSDTENQPIIKQPEETDSDDAQQISAIEIQKQQDALMMISQPIFILTLNDKDEESKDFHDAKSKVQNISIDGLAKIILKREFVKTQERIMQNLHKFQSNFDENNAAQILNILYFLKECSPFIKHCSFLSEEKRESIYIEVQKLLNYNENEEFFQNYFLNVSSFCSDFDNLFRYQYNCKYFRNEFRKSFSEITTSLYSSVQQISSRDESMEFSIEWQNLKESLTNLFISFKILMETRCIRTTILFVDKLIKTKSNFRQFLDITGLSSDESVAKSIYQFDILIKLTLHLKMIFIIHQLIEILDQISSTLNNKKRPPLTDNEIVNYMENQESINSTMQQILDEFSFAIKDKTEFLALANDFIHQLNKDMEVDDFKGLLHKLLSQSFSLLNKNFHQCGLKPVFFSLHYHYRMMQAATSSIIPLLRSETFDQTEYLQKYYISLKKLLKKFSSLEGKDIDIGIINDLYFSLMMQIKDPCHDVKPKSSYKGTSAFQNVYKYIKLCEKDLEIIENTICFAHQVDFFVKEYDVIDDELCFNLDCQFYLPSDRTYFKSYQNVQIDSDQSAQNDNYDSIIHEISFQLHSHGYDMIPNKYSQRSFCDISAPNISNAILIMLNYGDVIQIQKLIENPDQLGDEESLFSLINDIYKKVIDKPQSKLHLKESISVYLHTYFLLKALSLAEKINFSDAVHLMYFRTFASIIFNDDFIGKVSLVSPFNPSTHPCYRSILKRLGNLKEMKQINDEISHIRLFYFKFAGAIFQLDPFIIKSYLKIITRIFEWFSNPLKESNDKFLSNKYLTPVKEFLNFIKELVKNTKQTLNIHTSIYKALREIETILNSISNIQIHYIQFRKTELIIPYLRSFFSCKEDDKNLCQFVSFYPVWLNSIHRCLNYGLIQCDEDLLKNSFKSTQSNVIENSERLVSSFNIQYLSFFNDLINCSLKTYNQSISMIIDVIVRGSFTFSNISKLFSYILNYFVSIPRSESRPRYQLFMSSINYDLWRNLLKLSCFLIAVNMHPFLNKKLNLNLLRIMNLKNYVNSYINGLLYLHSSILSSSFDKESSSKILLSIKEMQKLVSDIPIVVKINETYFQISRIVLLIMSANRYLVEIGPEEGIIGRIESFIRNIQDKKLHDAFELSLKVALLSGTNSQGSTVLLSKTPNGSPVLAAQSVVSNGYDPIFYNKNEQNYLDGLSDVLNEYIDIDEELKSFIQRNTGNYANMNYFDENDDININVISCPLQKEVIEECFNDDERRVENYVKTIDMINILSLYLSIIKETNSFRNFVSLNFVSYVRLSPPFAIYKPPNWGKNDNSKLNFINISLNANDQLNKEKQEQQVDEEEKQTTIDTDWMKNNYELFNSCIDDYFEFKPEANSYCATETTIKLTNDENKTSNRNQLSIQGKIQAQLQILPFQYAFSDTGISSTKFRLKNLYNSAQQALKTEIPSPKPMDEFDSDQLLPPHIQQELVDKIDYIRKGNKPDFLEILKKQSLDEQKELQAKNNSSIYGHKEQPIPVQKDPLLLPKVIIKGREKLIKKSSYNKYQNSSDENENNNNNEEEENNQNDEDQQLQSQENPIEYGRFKGTDEEDEIEQPADEYIPPEVQDFAEERIFIEPVKTTRRGRPPRKKEKRIPKPIKNTDRSLSSPSSGLTIPLQSSTSSTITTTPIFSQVDAAPATGTISFMSRQLNKLNQLEIEEAKKRDLKDNIARSHPMVTSIISQMGNEIKQLSKSSTENVEKKSQYCEAVMMFNAQSNNYLVKTEELKRTQNANKGLLLSSSIEQKIINSQNDKSKIDSSKEEKLKTSYSLFNPFNLRSKSSTKINDNDNDIHSNSPLPSFPVYEALIPEPGIELTPSQLLLLHQKQIENISQSKIKQNQQNNQEDEVLNQPKIQLVSNEQDTISSQKLDGNQIEEIEEINQEQPQIDSSLSTNQNQHNNQSLLSFEEKLNNETIPPELKYYDQESPNYVSLPPQIRKLTRSCWSCLSKDDIDNNLLNNDQKMGSLIDNEKENDFQESKNEKLNDTSNQKSFSMLHHHSPAELQQLCNLEKRKIHFYEDIVKDLYNGNDDDKIKSKSNSNSLSSSLSNKKLSRTSSEKTKIDPDFSTRSKTSDSNDGQVLSDADVDIEGDSDVGFGLDGDF